MNIETTRTSTLKQNRRAGEQASSLLSLQEQIAEQLASNLAHYSWSGFYMLDPDDSQTLVLGPFVGDPTPHVRIPISQGIC